jgi:hypothetical protein
MKAFKSSNYSCCNVAGGSTLCIATDVILSSARLNSDI